MGVDPGQLAYWNTTGAGKTFTHPVEPAWLAGVDRSARVLDYGCGYGRVATELREHGFTDVTGVDPSTALVERARRNHPDLRFEPIAHPPALPPGLGRFDVVLLIAVLTCVATDDAQRALVDVVTQALAPGGLLYVSDLLLQDDERARGRYAAGATADALDAPYGTFRTGDGAVVRHHEPEHLRALVAHLEPVRQREVDVVTMNGNPARALQLLLRRPAGTAGREKDRVTIHPS